MGCSLAMFDSFRLLLVMTALSLVPWIPGELAKTALISTRVVMSKAVIGDANLTAMAQSNGAELVPSPWMAQSIVQSRQADPNSRTLVPWVALSLISVGAVGAAVYTLMRSAGEQSNQPLEAAAQPEQDLERSGQPPGSHPDASYVATSNEWSAVQPTELLRSEPVEITGSSQSSEPEAPLTPTTRLTKIDIVEALIPDLQSPEVAKRRKAIWELGQRGDSRAIQPLVDLLMDADSQQRSLILAAVSEISTRTLKPMHRALMVSLQDESADVRKNAIRDITRIYDQMTQISQLLQYAVSDSDDEVQETASWALGQLNRLKMAPLPTSKKDGLPHPDPTLDDRSP